MLRSQEIREAVVALRAGDVIGFPTETVYGLGADAENEDGLRRIFEIKGRPAWHPLIVHLPDASELDAWARDASPIARALANAFWPGPLTLVVRRGARIPLAATGGLETVGLRVPSHPIALALLRELDGAIAAPSANRFGGLSPTTADAVRAELGAAVRIVLDGGPCAVGVESTIVDVTDAPAILRPGGVPLAAIEAVVGGAVPLGVGGPVRSPGQLESHYAPRAHVVVSATDRVAEGIDAARARGLRVGVLTVAGIDVPEGVTVERLPDDDAGRARGLYAALRRLDDVSDVVVAALPGGGALDWAVDDRLARAAAPRTPDGDPRSDARVRGS